ncbi:uncharacterized protein A4U43_C10F17760 [Asparagus officinalis]|uniref:Uncharacterized protein n=1 Tax=Asparagus officinalis TaxID=4686 RepID=A0A5P1E5G3_ASPOF|nr:uncharacterized protein A4U43_C10F17760 [Asparagus officinalis]
MEILVYKNFFIFVFARRRADVVVSLGNDEGELISSEEKAAASKARDLVVSRADVVGGELISSEEKAADLGISSEEKAADLVGIGNVGEMSGFGEIFEVTS